MATWAGPQHEEEEEASGRVWLGVAWSAKVAAVSCVADKDELGSPSRNWSRSRSL